jgi:hypothetical protein
MLMVPLPGVPTVVVSETEDTVKFVFVWEASVDSLRMVNQGIPTKGLY